MKETLSEVSWWKSLSFHWLQAFRSIAPFADEPAESELEMFQDLTVIRLAGPTAPFPNCSVELTDLSGLQFLVKLETVIVTHHHIETIEEVARLPRLKSLFLYNNRIRSLSGIERLLNLEQLYVQCNQLESIREIEQLHNLRELYISDNNIITLDGLTEAHAGKLKKFVCLPNERLKQKEIINAERELGIICR